MTTQQDKTLAQLVNWSIPCQDCTPAQTERGREGRGRGGKEDRKREVRRTVEEGDGKERDRERR